VNDLRRELAPVGDEAWTQIEQEARRTLKSYLAARKLVDFHGPLGWHHSALNLGRVARLEESPSAGVEARLRVVQPLVELRAPFELARDELDAVDRGAGDVELGAVVDAAQRLAMAEDRLVFYGHRRAGVRGICEAAEHPPIALATDFTDYPQAVSEAVEVLRAAGVAGPYALALGPECYTGLARTVGVGGYPVIQHVKRLLDGPVVWAPALEGALVLSLRGGDFELTVGRDISIGYLEHDRGAVKLYLEESLTFRLLTPSAAVVLRQQR
jgi:uncharacterized linocin/CFP29 family protein